MDLVERHFPTSSSKGGLALDSQGTIIPASNTPPTGIPPRAAAEPVARRRLFPPVSALAPEPAGSAKPLSSPPPLPPLPASPPLLQAQQQQRPLQIGRTSLLKWSPAGSLSSLLAAVHAPHQAVHAPSQAVQTPQQAPPLASATDAGGPVPASPVPQQGPLPSGAAAAGGACNLTEEVQAVQRALLGALSGGGAPAGPTVPPRRQYRPIPVWAKAFPK